MAMIGIFDQWQKDAFFSAAEEVQESADRMESVYRMWMRDRSNGVGSEVLDDLYRELHIALGTTKWQLEEFERAVKLSRDRYLSEENKATVARRSQFVAAISNQVSHIERVLNDSLIEDGKEALLWVRLDEDERDEFAAFLSAGPSERRIASCAVDGYKDVLAVDKDMGCEIVPGEVSRKEDEFCTDEEQLNGERGNLACGYLPDWKIAIPDERNADKKLLSEKKSEISSCNYFGILKRVEFVAKSKWFRNRFRKTKSEEHPQLKYKLPNYLDCKGVALLTQQFNGLTERSSYFSNWKARYNLSCVQNLPVRADGLERQHTQGPQCQMQFGRSFRITLLLVSSIVLIVPVILY